MADRLPLLLFPKAKPFSPDKPPGGFGAPSTNPGFAKQAQQFGPKIEKIKEKYEAEYTRLSGEFVGVDPEMVLVFTVKGNMQDFSEALRRQGFDWLGQNRLDEAEPDDDFYFWKTDKKDKRIKEKDLKKSIPRQLFMSMTNKESLDNFMMLWNQYARGKVLETGATKFKDIFNHLENISYWGPEQRLSHCDFLEFLNEEEQFDPNEAFEFQIELWYRNSEVQRRDTERQITQLIEGLDGEVLSVYDQLDIKFHALKVSMPYQTMKDLVDRFSEQQTDKQFDLLRCHEIMLFASPGICSVDSEGDPAIEELLFQIPKGDARVALLDGVPLLNHVALRDGLVFDDPDSLMEQYQTNKQMQHGTAMASLILHGDLEDPQRQTISSRLYVRPVLIPDPGSRDQEETLVKGRFPEDLIERAVVRMLNPENGVAPKVKVINLSLGLRDRPFVRQISSWARLLDFLSMKYNVLFIVSAGNCAENLLMDNKEGFFDQKPKEQRFATLSLLNQNRSRRRLLSPAESVNALTVGSSHSDQLDEQTGVRKGYIFDVLPRLSGEDVVFPSPINPLGGGFRRAMKPDILAPGGRQLYQEGMGTNSGFRIFKGTRPPGVKAAAPGENGQLDAYKHSRGTSNAAALLTHSAGHLLSLIDELQQQSGGSQIEDKHIPVLLKALLVHSAQRSKKALHEFQEVCGQHQKKSNYLAELFFGYGVVGYQRVMQCTQQRAIVVGVGAIRQTDDLEEFVLPVPKFLDRYEKIRRITVTLAWFSPINPSHFDYYRAKMSFSLPRKGSHLKSNGDLSKTQINYPGVENQFNSDNTKRSTVQHQVFEGRKVMDIGDGESLPIHIKLNKGNAGGVDFALVDEIPYALVVSFEVGQGETVDIYSDIKAGIELQVQAQARAR